MNSVWQTLTLSTLPLQQWLNSSFLHYPIGRLRTWRKGSWLMQWAEPIGGGLAMLVFALAPFVNNTLTGLLLGACGTYWLLLTISDDRSPESGGNAPFATPIHLLVGLYWSIAVVATAMSPVKREALVGLQKLTLYLLFFALLARVLRSPRIRSWVITVFLLTALAVSVYGLQQWTMGTDALATWVDPESPLSKTTRVYSYLGNPNLLAGYLVPAVVFSIVAFFSWNGWMCKALAVIMTAVNGACLILTFSRGGWIGLVFSLFVLLLLLAHWWSIHLPRFWRTWALPIVLGTAAAVVLLAVVVVEPLRDRVGSIFAGRGDSSNNFRINVWTAVIEMIKDFPVWGIGPGNTAFNKIYPRYMRARYSALSAYSIILEVALETGIIGLMCFLWLIFVTLSQGWRAIQRLRLVGSQEGFWLMGAIASLVGMLGHGMVDTVLYRPEVNTLWWLMFALIASYYGHARLSEEQVVEDRV
ncbi:MAG: putative bicarbonate transporter, IctB family [Oscillatoriales cyanobacterium C42_A2020_001]|nr:putative bicarbonate transporter, IctB family [Leptolyngbyaceae cyanobacterium C42_A2020_001]